MLSRENRILSELIVSRALATPEAVERRARELPDSSERDLVEELVAHGELDPTAGASMREEARAIDRLLRADLPDDRTLGDYRLLRELGRGGMGIVYEAEQLSLGRRVALKVLPAGLSLDEQMAIRFLREARSVARLTHPGIVPVFDTGREQGVLYFTMELIDGETLEQRIERGPLPAREAARITAEVARALQHAHEAGLVHRDVKPENVILGKDDRARLADFGLVHDLRAVRLTRSQYVLGTPAYAAPEQAREGPVDVRSDVYGAGATLYAMLAGRAPFQGEVPAAVLGRLIQGPPPPLASAAPGTPAALVAICERAMARDRDRRYPSAQALADALERFAEGPHEDAPAGQRARGARLLAVIAAVVSAALVVAAGFWWLPSTERARPAVASETLDAGLLARSQRLFPTAPGSKPDIALSPDGETLAYVTASPPGLFLQRFGAAEPVPLGSHDAAPSSLAWSADGSRIAFCASQRLAIAEVDSGAVRVTQQPCGPMSWSPDGTRIVYSERPAPLTRLVVFDLSSGDSRLITGPGAFWPAWSSEGRIAFVAIRDGQYDLWTVREDGSDERRVTNDDAREVYPAWSSTRGVLYFGSNRDESPDLWRVRLDSAGEAVAEPARLTRGWFGAPFQLCAARQRERLAFVHEINLTQSWVLRLDGSARPLGPPENSRLDLPFDAGNPERSPTGEDWIVAARRGDAENLLRWAPSSAAAWITAGSFHDGAPRWSPDGTSIAFHSDRSGTSQIWTVGADGTRLTQVTADSGHARDPVWSPDGAQIAYSVAGGSSRVKTLTREAATPLLDGFEPWSWSADGRRLAGTAGGIVVIEVAGGALTRVSDQGQRPSWVGDSGELLFTHENRIFHWSGRGEPRAIWSAGPNRLAAGLSLAAGGREVYFATTSSTERVFVLDLDAALTE